LTFMYFRALHILRKEKATWDGSNGLVGSHYVNPLSEERKKMIQESANAEFRIARMEHAMQKAKSGYESKMRRTVQERLEKVSHKDFFDQHEF
jgi:predicted subunit of tRNA(5-methylaminomethyl-2-thiouridylate) methyltransferase